MGTADRKHGLSKRFTAFTKAESAHEITPRRFKIRRFLRQMYAKWLLRRARGVFEKYLAQKEEITPLVLNIGARIYFHCEEYMIGTKYARQILGRDFIGPDQRALALAILAECHEKIKNSMKPSESYRIIFADLYDKLEPINQIRVLRSRAAFEGRRGNLVKAERDIARARRIATERMLVDELLKLKALEMTLFVE